MDILESFQQLVHVQFDLILMKKIAILRFLLDQRLEIIRNELKHNILNQPPLVISTIEKVLIVIKSIYQNFDHMLAIFNLGQYLVLSAQLLPDLFYPLQGHFSIMVGVVSFENIPYFC